MSQKKTLKLQLIVIWIVLPLFFVLYTCLLQLTNNPCDIKLFMTVLQFHYYPKLLLFSCLMTILLGIIHWRVFLPDMGDPGWFTVKTDKLPTLGVPLLLFFPMIFSFLWTGIALHFPSRKPHPGKMMVVQFLLALILHEVIKTLQNKLIKKSSKKNPNI